MADKKSYILIRPLQNGSAIGNFYSITNKRGVSMPSGSLVDEDTFTPANFKQLKEKGFLKEILAVEVESHIKNLKLKSVSRADEVKAVYLKKLEEKKKNKGRW